MRSLIRINKEFLLFVKATLLKLNTGMQNIKITRKIMTLKIDFHPALLIAAVFGVLRNICAFDRLTDTCLSVLLLSQFWRSTYSCFKEFSYFFPMELCGKSVSSGKRLRLSWRYTITWTSYIHFMNIKRKVALHGRIQGNITAEVENQECFAEFFSWVWSRMIYCYRYGLDFPDCFCLQQLTLFLLFQNEGLLPVSSDFIH